MVKGNNEVGAIKLLQKQKIGTIDAKTAGKLTGTGFSFSSIGAGFVDRDGNDVSGAVSVSGRYVSASNMDLLTETMLGGDFEATDAGGNNVTLNLLDLWGLNFNPRMASLSYQRTIAQH